MTSSQGNRHNEYIRDQLRSVYQQHQNRRHDASGTGSEQAGAASGGRPDGSTIDEPHIESIYDRLLRIMMIHKADWLILVEQGICHGFLTKKMILEELSEIAPHKRTTVRIPTEQAVIPPLSATLANLHSQSSFPIIDTEGSILKTVDRAACLRIAESLSGDNEPKSITELGISVAMDNDTGSVTKREDSSGSANQLDWFMSTLLENLPFGLLATDRRFRTIFYNERFRDIILMDLTERTPQGVLHAFEAMERRLRGHKTSLAGAGPRQKVLIPLHDTDIVIRAFPLVAKGKTIGYFFIEWEFA